MARLEGLKMQGIRSIGDNAQIINFLHPLTIIQGANGTGKTTVIEALSYVTTGTLPAGKMQAFIHNNQVAQKSRVDALVQLRFRDVRNNTITATKRMCANISKAAKLTTKSDEYTLVVEDAHGNPPRSLSSKVVEFNKEMLNLLGVPKAILENVIFCHQEDSNWPLSEPKELKSRFDAIFEVTKYVRTLDNLKKIKKELDGQIKVIDAQLPFLETDRKARATLRINYDESCTRLEKSKEDVAKLLEQKREADEKMALMRTRLESVAKKASQTDKLRNQMDMKREFLANLNSVADYPGTREQLTAEMKHLRTAPDDTKLEIERKAAAIRECGSAMREADEAYKLASKGLSKAEQSLTQLTNTIALKRAEVEKLNSKISKVATRETVESKLAKVSEQLQKARSELGQIDGCRFLYSKWEEECEWNDCCPLCERDFDQAEKKKELLTKIRQKQTDLPMETKTLQAKVRKFEEEERQLTHITPLLGMVKSTEEEIPSLEAQRQRAETDVDKQRQLKEQREEELRECREKLNVAHGMKVQQSTRAQELRTMEDQLRKKDFAADLEELQRQLEQLIARQAREDEKENGGGVGEGGGDHKSLMRDYEQLTNKSAELNNRIQRLKGEQSQMEQKVRELKKEIASSRYADAKKSYVEKSVERHVIATAIEDLQKYYKTLDDAIIEFHHQKMAQINHLLRELWTRVYQGNDIETIKIKSQPVADKTEKTRKSYDYSVVMSVEGVDIDMRDRCSAGQKVLASILIRIALADVFAGNCPILALDEPTTNLDAEKVENVGQMLKSLIEWRNPVKEEPGDEGDNEEKEEEGDADQSNTEPVFSASRGRSLQLIVITHDKRLVDHLFLACRPEYVYGLSKDDSGVSRVKLYKRIDDLGPGTDN